MHILNDYGRGFYCWVLSPRYNGMMGPKRNRSRYCLYGVTWKIRGKDFSLALDQNTDGVPVLVV
jgi:hypothetical protein